MRFWMLLAVVHGLMVLAGALVTVHHLLTLRRLGIAQLQEAVPPSTAA